jgi:hypothetical protein
MSDESLERKELGKIRSVEFGLGGYQDACLGIQFGLSGESWGVGDWKGPWDFNLIECDSHCRWTEEDRTKQAVEMLKFISDLLRDAKVSHISQLKNKPIEVTFKDYNTLQSWRILKEVL